MSITQVEPSFLTSKIVRDLKTLALTGMPNEVCGAIHEHGIVQQYPNTFCGNQKHGFDMELDIREAGLRALWHSHPGGLREPSKDDIPCMERLAAHGYDFPWVIVTAGEVTAWIFSVANVGSSLVT